VPAVGVALRTGPARDLSPIAKRAPSNALRGSEQFSVTQLPSSRMTSQEKTKVVSVRYGALNVPPES
jgi:hypothetical protein